MLDERQNRLLQRLLADSTDMLVDDHARTIDDIGLRDAVNAEINADSTGQISAGPGIWIAKVIQPPD